MTCGTCRHWLTLGLPKRRMPWWNSVGKTWGVELRDCACLAGRGGEQRESAEACDAYKERGR